MRKWIEGTGYYLSCMIMFNTIYALSIATNGKVFKKICSHYDIARLSTFVIVCLLAFLGIIATVRILTVDDTKDNPVSTGKKFEVLSVEDQTGENYFANFSVIVLTGVALPSNPNFAVLVIFLLIEVSLGVVYIKKSMYYMNPVLTLMDYSIYKCTGRDKTTGDAFNGDYYFLTRRRKISLDSVVEYKNIESHIIRLNK